MCEAAYPTWGHREPDSLSVALKMSFKKHLENPYNPPTVRKLHNKENSTNCQNTERTPQTQQYKQDEETEEYPTGKGTG